MSSRRSLPLLLLLLLLAPPTGAEARTVPPPRMLVIEAATEDESIKIRIFVNTNIVDIINPFLNKGLSFSWYNFTNHNRLVWMQYIIFIKSI